MSIRCRLMKAVPAPNSEKLSSKPSETLRPPNEKNGNYSSHLSKKEARAQALADADTRRNSLKTN